MLYCSVEGYAVENSGTKRGDRLMQYGKCPAISRHSKYRAILLSIFSLLLFSPAFADDPPISNSPPDQSLTLGSDTQIIWILQDDNNGGFYYVEKEGSPFKGPLPWQNNTPLLIIPDTHFLGLYNYTIFFNDSSNNNGTPDSVFINITPRSLPICNSSAYDSTHPTLETITIDGDVTEWAPVLLNLNNYVADEHGSADADTGITADRDFKLFAYTYDSNYFYFYFDRLTTGNNVVSALVYIDYDLDGYMNSTDKVVEFRWQGNVRTYDAYIYNYIPSSTADKMNGSGFDMPGSITLNATGESNMLGGTSSGLKLEARVAWSLLNLSSPKPFLFQAASSRGTNLPSQLEDNIDVISSDSEWIEFLPNYTKAGLPGTSIYFVHDIMNCGNVNLVIDLNNLSALGWNITLYYPNGTMITDTNSNGIPDIFLNENGSTSIILKLDVPLSASFGTIETASVEAFYGNKSLGMVADNLIISSLVITPPLRQLSSTNGSTVLTNFTVTNYQSSIDIVEINTTSPNGWAISLYYENGTALSDTDSDGVIDLGTFLPSESKIFILMVSIPSGVSIGTIDLINITINSSFNSTLSSGALANISVRKRLTIDPDYNRSVGIGSYTVYPLIVTNNWNESDTIDIFNTSTMGWGGVFYNADLITLLADTDGDGLIDVGKLAPFGGSYTLYLRVSVPISATEASSDIRYAYANSSLVPSIYDTSRINTTAAKIVTFEDPSFLTPRSLFQIGSTVYAQAYAITVNNVYFRWIDPTSTIIKTSGTIGVNPDLTADDFLPTNSSLLSGNWTVIVFRSNNNAEISRAYFLLGDFNRPTLTIQSPSNTTYNYSTLDLNYTVYDSNLDSCWYSIDNSANITLPSCQNTTIGPLTNGQHNITVYANDTAGNTNSSTVWFTVKVDSLFLYASVLYPVNNTLLYPNQTSNFTCQVNSTCTQGDCSPYNISVLFQYYNGSSWLNVSGAGPVAANSSYEANFTGLSGNNSFNLTWHFNLTQFNYTAQLRCIAFSSQGGSSFSSITTYTSFNDLDVGPIYVIPQILHYENYTSTINATIFSHGEYNLTNVSVALLINNTLSSLQYLNFSQGQSNATFSYSPPLKGNYSLEIRVDYDESIPETNDTSGGWEQSNNFNTSWLYANSTLWATLYGNVTSTLILASSSAVFHTWSSNTSNITIYIANSDASISWSSLRAIGRTISNSPSSNDFNEIDNVLGSTLAVENINRTFSIDGSAPKNTTSFLAFGNNIPDVPIFPSTSCSSSWDQCFTTGILWDSSDDTGNSEFDPSDSEDLIFISNIRRAQPGAYGTYDYEIRVPAYLDSYTGSSGTISIWVELRN
ncbi:MAG: CARDB domain-containing protein [Candidatus Anstonellales archaeon]